MAEGAGVVVQAVVMVKEVVQVGMVQLGQGLGE